MCECVLCMTDTRTQSEWRWVTANQVGRSACPGSPICADSADSISSCAGAAMHTAHVPIGDDCISTPLKQLALQSLYVSYITTAVSRVSTECGRSNWSLRKALNPYLQNWFGSERSHSSPWTWCFTCYYYESLNFSERHAATGPGLRARPHVTLLLFFFGSCVFMAN